jgi:hypothetical protein
MDQPRTDRTDRTIEDAPPGAVSRGRALQAEQMDEIGGTPTTPAVPQPMFTGMVKGAVIGAVVGALLLTPLAFADILDLSLAARLVICWIAGAAAGATMGAVFTAGARSEQANEENQEYIYGEDPHERRQGPGIG